MKNKLLSSLKILTACFLTAAVLCSCSLEYILFGEEQEALPEGKLSVHFLDVGQGDSIFAELPNGESMLVDAGDNYYGENIIKYIESEGFKKIDYLVATHPHADHIGSMPYIVRNFEIGSIYMPKVSANTSLYETLLKSIKSKSLTVQNGKAGVTIVSGDDFSADILAPVKIDEKNLNNCSIVIKLSYGKRSFLLTGDAETGEMKTIKSDLSADVLKAGHHGSKTSTTDKILKSVNPDIAVISCGKNNDYGHPDEDVLKRLKAAGCSIYRTDKHKTVVIETDGESLTVETDHTSIKRAS